MNGLQFILQILLDIIYDRFCLISRGLYQKGFIDIRIFVGYYNDESDPHKPASDLVYDSLVKAEVAALLTGPYEEVLFACGFSQDLENPPALIGVYACNTDHYYREGLTQAAPHTGLVATGPLTHLENNHGTLVGTINSILGMKCEEDFRSSLPRASLLGFFSN